GVVLGDEKRRERGGLRCGHIGCRHGEFLRALRARGAGCPKLALSTSAPASRRGESAGGVADSGAPSTSGQSLSSTPSIRLVPLTRRTGQPDHPPILHDDAGSTRAPAVSQKRILIVDDDPATALLCSRLLQTAGYATIIARDATQAVLQAHREPPALI